jgi:hypothetical protein
MDRHHHRIQAVMVGVGGVFPVYAGVLRRAPKWMQAICLEWAYRLWQEPRRLWLRYVRVIPVFIILAVLQLLSMPLTAIRANWNVWGRAAPQSPSPESKPVKLLLTSKEDR